jgi:hypothetical protein
MAHDPALPQCLIVCVRIQETCQLIHVVDDPVPALQVAKNVECVKGEIIERRKRGITQVTYLPDNTPAPEFIHARYAKTSRCAIPKAEVQVDGWWHFGVIFVSTPPPPQLPGHLGQMICGKFL